MLDVREEIFDWAHCGEIDLSANYIKGSLNITADLASHVRNFSKEWRLIPATFAKFRENPPLIFLQLELTLTYPFFIFGSQTLKY